VKRITLQDVAPELRPRLRLIPRPRFQSALYRQFQRWINARMPSPRVEGVSIETVDEGACGLRVYTPSSRRFDGALLWIHGGGYIVGHPVQNDNLCALTASRLGIVVVAPRYRLAPEHPFPAGIDDCHAGWTWMRASSARLGIDPDRIVIGGESAGGGLAAALIQRVHDEDGPGAFAQWLFCPMIDDRTAADRALDVRAHFLWDNQANAFGWRSYLAQEPGSDSPPPYSVPSRREDLGGLPPAWIGTSDLDVFHDEDALYAERLKAAGVPVRFFDVAAAPHGFHAFAPDVPLSKGFVADARQWLEERLADETARP
jgi:acetyl esterase/lipase